MHDIAIAPSNEDIVYALSHHFVWNWSKPRIFKSTDGGSWWDQMGILSDSLDGYSMTVHPVDPNILYVGGKQRVYKSIDGGANWTQYSVSTDTIPSIAVNPSSPSHVYACGKEGGFAFFKSIDNGVTWNTDTLETLGIALDLAIAPSQHNTVYVAGRRGGPPVQRRPRVFKSIDGGETFTDVTNNLADSAAALRMIRSVAVHETIPDIIYVGTIKSIWQSSDGGSTWSEAFMCSTQVYEIATTSDNPSVIYASTSRRVYKSMDAGTTWTLTDTVGLEYRIQDLDAKPSEDSTVFTASNTSSGIMMTINGGESWYESTDGMTMHKMFCSAVSQTSPEVIYIQSHGVGVYKSTDYGATWNKQPDFSSCLSVCDFAIHNASADTVLSLEGEG
jgi:photosystem II stability/assembly factor-like uncharacterized protein